MATKLNKKHKIQIKEKEIHEILMVPTTLLDSYKTNSNLKSLGLFFAPVFLGMADSWPAIGAGLVFLGIGVYGWYERNKIHNQATKNLKVKEEYDRFQQSFPKAKPHRNKKRSPQ